MHDLRPLIRFNALRVRAATRRRLTQLMSLKGVISIVVICAFIWFIRSSYADAGSLTGLNGRFSSDFPGDLLPMLMLVGCLLTVFLNTSASVHFSPAEMNLLFTAPVKRSSLVLNKCLSYLLGATLSALLLAVIVPASLMPISRAHFALTTLLALAFIQLFSTVMGMTALVLKKKFVWLPGRQITIALALLLIGTLSLYGYLQYQSPLIWTRWILDSPPTQWLLAPFEPVAGLYQTRNTGSMLPTLLPVVCLEIAMLLAAIVHLDHHLQDESSDSSAHAHRRWQAILKSGSVWQRSAQSHRSRQAPRRFTGAVPIAWTQLLRMSRSAGPLIIGLLLLAAPAGVLLGSQWQRLPTSSVLGAVFFVFVFMLPRTLVYDFRGNPDAIEYLKTLPAPAWTVCLGQIGTPVVFTCLLQWIATLSAAPFATPAVQHWLAMLCIAMVPTNVLLFSVENISFLLAPTRMVPVGRVDFDFLGRTLADFMIKSLALAFAVSIALLAARYALRQWPDQHTLAAVTGISALFLQSALAVCLMSMAYRRFDSSQHRHLS